MSDDGRPVMIRRGLLPNEAIVPNRRASRYRERAALRGSPRTRGTRDVAPLGRAAGANYMSVEWTRAANLTDDGPVGASAGSDARRRSNAPSAGVAGLTLAPASARVRGASLPRRSRRF